LGSCSTCGDAAKVSWLNVLMLGPANSPDQIALRIDRGAPFLISSVAIIGYSASRIVICGATGYLQDRLDFVSKPTVIAFLTAIA
jgi:hypothetical protein